MVKVIVSFLIFVQISYAQVHERWDVKTLTDGYTPSLANAKQETVKEIRDIEPSPFHINQPRYDFEKSVVTLTGVVKRRVLEADGDYHIEIQDESLDSTVACEAVDPQNEITKTSSSIDLFKNVRLTATSLKVGDSISITGLLFQDKRHSPSPLRTRNFVEIHPILSLSVLSHLAKTAKAKPPKPQWEPHRCMAITQKGTQCKRMAQEGSDYCWQHQR